MLISITAIWLPKGINYKLWKGINYKFGKIESNFVSVITKMSTLFLIISFN